MSLFSMYLKLGIEHITDLQGYDHILFILTLCGIYLLYQWKKILILITAFTLGHTTTLVLATFNIISVNSQWIEFLIPLTIFITSLANIFHKKTEFSARQHRLKYALAAFFGLIHGLGFSNYLKNLLGMEKSLFTSLLAFNIGIELGQIVIVAIILIIAQLVVFGFNVPRREWNLVISGMGLGISLILMLERLPV
ncbi:MAG: HupE/UreJ family protein [Bacteroidota bacterium]